MIEESGLLSREDIVAIRRKADEKCAIDARNGIMRKPLAEAPGAAASAQLFLRANHAVDIRLMANPTRTDLTYKTLGPWFTKPVTAMAGDLQAAAMAMRAATPAISAVVPVGEAWNRAIADGIADPDPYDGITFGQVDLWPPTIITRASTTIISRRSSCSGITGVPPRTIGPKESAADDLGITPETAVELQTVAQGNCWRQGIHPRT